MKRYIGKGLAIALAVGGLLHGYGSFLAFPTGSPELVWSLGSAAFAIFLAVLAFHAEGAGAAEGSRRILVGGLAAWFATVLGFGLAIGDVGDPRVLYHLVVSAGLVVRFVLDRGDARGPRRRAPDGPERIDLSSASDRK